MVNKELIDYVNSKIIDLKTRQILHGLCGCLLADSFEVGKIKSIIDSMADVQFLQPDVSSSADPHEVSKVRCDLCGYEWIAVRPLGVEKLECKQCGNISNFENIGT